MSGKRAGEAAWGLQSSAVLVAASVAMVAWIAVGAAMLFSRPAPPADVPVTTGETSSLLPSTAPGSVQPGPTLRTGTYARNIPTVPPRKPPKAKAHPAQTGSASGSTAPAPTTTAPAPPPAPVPTQSQEPAPPPPPAPEPTPDDCPGNGNGHGHGNCGTKP